MRVSCRLWVVVAAAAMLHVGGGQATAQIELGGAASVSNIRGTTFGLGGRLGVPIKRGSFGAGVRLEAAVDYYWPSCSSVKCDAIGTSLDVVFQDQVFGQAHGYFGLGGTYQNYKLVRDDETVLDGDSWGVNFLVGSRYAGRPGLRPFVEIRWTLMDDIDNQWAVVLGTTVTLGR